MNSLELFVLRTLLTIATLFVLGVLLETADRPWWSRAAYMVLILTMILMLFASFNGIERYAHATLYFIMAFTVAAGVTFFAILRTITDPIRLAKLKKCFTQYGVVVSLTLGIVWLGGSCGGKGPVIKNQKQVDSLKSVKSQSENTDEGRWLEFKRRTHADR